MRLALSYPHHPLTGLLLVKVAAVGLGIYCWRWDHHRLLSRVNLLFAAVVVWNVAALIIASAQMKLI